MNKSLENEFTNFFKFFKEAVIRIKKLGEQEEFIDDAVFLCCIYLDALSTFRYGGNNNRKFIQFLQTYPNQHCKEFYNSLCSWMLVNPIYDKNGKPPKIRLNNRKHTPAFILHKLKINESNHTDIKNDLSIEQAIHKLKGVNRDELNKFSFAGYFYSYYRCFGLHNAQLIHGWTNIRGREPFYMASSKNWEIVIPIDFVIETLESSVDNFEKEIAQKLNCKKYKSRSKYEFAKWVYCIKNDFINTYMQLERRQTCLNQYK